MSRANAAWIAAVVMFTGLGWWFKLEAGERFVFPDVARADRELVARMEMAGFIAQPPRTGMRIAHVFRREDCIVLTGIAGDMGQDRARWTLARKTGEIVRFHYRGTSRPDFPRLRAPLEDQFQRQLARLGVALARPAVVATIQADDCASLPALSDIPIHVGVPMPKSLQAPPLR